MYIRTRATSARPAGNAKSLAHFLEARANAVDELQGHNGLADIFLRNLNLLALTLAIRIGLLEPLQLVGQISNYPRMMTHLLQRYPLPRILGEESLQQVRRECATVRRSSRLRFGSDRYQTLMRYIDVLVRNLPHDDELVNAGVPTVLASSFASSKSWASCSLTSSAVSPSPFGRPRYETPKSEILTRWSICKYCKPSNVSLKVTRAWSTEPLATLFMRDELPVFWNSSLPCLAKLVGDIDKGSLILFSCGRHLLPETESTVVAVETRERRSSSPPPDCASSARFANRNIFSIGLSIVLPTSLSLITPGLYHGNIFWCLGSPMNLTPLYPFQNNCYNVRMSSLLQNGNLLLHLVLRSRDKLPELPSLRVPLDNLDGNVRIVRLQITTELDFTMRAATELVYDFIVVDQLSARNRVDVHIGYVGLLRRLSVGEMQERTRVGAGCGENKPEPGVTAGEFPTVLLPGGYLARVRTTLAEHWGRVASYGILLALWCGRWSIGCCQCPAAVCTLDTLTGHVTVGVRSLVWRTKEGCRFRPLYLAGGSNSASTCHRCRGGCGCTRNTRQFSTRRLGAKVIIGCCWGSRLSGRRQDFDLDRHFRPRGLHVTAIAPGLGSLPADFACADPSLRISSSGAAAVYCISSREEQEE
ncbi:hypothetical protein KC359_g51 [Hortaea werneckii]|nr:hypothetical protein KC359_g51 [Hortaea werneckii]